MYLSALNMNIFFSNGEVESWTLVDSAAALESANKLILVIINHSFLRTSSVHYETEGGALGAS